MIFGPQVRRTSTKGTDATSAPFSTRSSIHAAAFDGPVKSLVLDLYLALQIVLLRLRVAQGGFPDVACAVRRGALGVADAPPLRRPPRRAVLVVLPITGVLAAGIRLFDPRRAAVDLQAAVACDLDIRDRASPLHIACESAHRRDFLHARAPAAHVPAVEDW